MKTYSKMKTIKANGLTFVVREDTSDFKAIKEVVIDGSYERRDFKIEPGETWIDIGSNCGAFAVLAASKGAAVIAFEPDPENASIARANIEANRLGRNAKVNEVGVTDSEAAAESAFYRNTAKGNLWRNSLHRKWRGGETIKVKTVPVSPYWQAANCIKLDAEGIEMPILEKYADVRVKKLVFEWSFDIDASLPRFERVIATLKRTYPNVVYSGYAKGYTEWQDSWFPACRTVWCW
jgi:FkbM family methyltransferase